MKFMVLMILYIIFNDNTNIESPIIEKSKIDRWWKQPRDLIALTKIII